MKKVRILHNPKAGDEGHSKDDLIALVKSKGFTCEYASIKDSNWYKINYDIDFLVIAGGDGTVRQITKKLLERRLVDKRFPLALIPLGTANNLANTLKLIDESETATVNWHFLKTKKFDVGLVYGLKQASFFLEGMGYGVFPALMEVMSKIDPKLKDTPEKKLNLALHNLQKIISDYEPNEYTIEIDGIEHAGKYLLVEVMNTCSIGPNLNLSPKADPGDGSFELVLITEDDRDRLINYVTHKIKGDELSTEFKRITCKKVKVKCSCKFVHLDDELITLNKSNKLEIQLQNGLIEFLVN